MDMATKSEASSDPCGKSDSWRFSGDSDVVAVEGIWNELGLKELGEPERGGKGGAESADSGGSTNHDLYGEGCAMEVRVSSE